LLSAESDVKLSSAMIAILYFDHHSAKTPFYYLTKQYQF